jgi:hypothetical protein
MAEEPKYDGKIDIEVSSVISNGEKGMTDVGFSLSARGLTSEGKRAHFSVSMPDEISSHKEKSAILWVPAKDGHTYFVSQRENGEVSVGPILAQFEDHPVNGAGQPEKTLSDPVLAAAIKSAGLKALASVSKDEVVPTESFDEIAKVAHKALQAAGVEPISSDAGKAR